MFTRLTKALLVLGLAEHHVPSPTQTRCTCSSRPHVGLTFEERFLCHAVMLPPFLCTLSSMPLLHDICPPARGVTLKSLPPAYQHRIPFLTGTGKVIPGPNTHLHQAWRCQQKSPKPHPFNGVEVEKVSYRDQFMLWRKPTFLSPPSV